MTRNQANIYLSNEQEKEKLFHDAVYGSERLKEIEVFSKFSDSELRKLHSYGKMLKVRSKVNIVIEGERSSGLFILMNGRVSIYKSDGASHNLARFAILEEGASFGELSLFDDAPRSATVIADVDSLLFYLDADDFHRYLNESGADLQVKFYKTCAVYLAVRFRKLNVDYINSQQLLWKHALRKEVKE
jgi:CRP-like cAMP-binding protein